MDKLSIEIAPYIYQEMLVHPALFSHQKPQKIAVVGDAQGRIISEILKHDTVTETWHINPAPSSNNDARLQHYPKSLAEWINDKHSLASDIIITENHSPSELLIKYHTTLHSDGILVQLCDSPFQVHTLKKAQEQLINAQFKDILLLSFPQPIFPTGWRSVLMAKKNGVFKKIREKDIFNKNFITKYYNFDIHNSALAMPEFLRAELMS